MSFRATTHHPRATTLTWRIPEVRNDATGRYAPGEAELESVAIAGKDVSEPEWYATLHPGEWQTLHDEAMAQIDWDQCFSGRHAAE